jgi:hypothetical protein
VVATDGLYVFDISNPANPTIVESFSYPSEFLPSKGGWVEVRDNLAYVTSFPDYRYGNRRGGLAIFKINDDDGLASLTPAVLWLGLKNSDDQGTKFDLRTEVYINDTLVADGIARCIQGVTRNPSRAKEVTVPFGPITNGALEPGDLLSLTVLTRIGTNSDDSKCPGHNNAVGLRLYYDAVSRPSRVGAELAPEPLTDLFLHADALLDASAPTATAVQFQDSLSLNFSGGNPWQAIGTWSLAIP